MNLLFLSFLMFVVHRLQDDEMVENAMKGEMSISNDADANNKENCVIQ
jgi:hypothetical protein